VTADTIELREYQDSPPLALADVDARHIDLELRGRIGISRTVEGEAYILNPNQYVGVAVLPSGRRLEAWPKVPVHSVVHMLSVAHRFPFREQRADFSRLDAVLEVMARFFLALVEERLRLGLYRAYVEREENLQALRGRIVFPDDVRRNYLLRHRIFCRYAELTWDVPENQIVRQVAHLLSRWDFAPRVRQRLSQIDAELGEITPTTISSRAMDTFRYHRLNDDYRSIHELCRLILHGASVSEQRGPFSFPTFLIDMNKLFEDFVSEVVLRRQRWPIEVRCQQHGHLARGPRVRMVPDILVDVGHRAALVADCKYKRIEPEEFKNHDIYQVLAYCTALRVPRALVIYPRHMGVLEDDLQILNTDVVIRRRTIDLNLPPVELDSECDRFADNVLRWAAEDCSHAVAQRAS
jgi:5-methylcytosine-specific restriction enzyme subunit McrC